MPNNAFTTASSCVIVIVIVIVIVNVCYRPSPYYTSGYKEEEVYLLKKILNYFTTIYIYRYIERDIYIDIHTLYI